jgi:hypothetical protein
VGRVHRRRCRGETRLTDAPGAFHGSPGRCWPGLSHAPRRLLAIMRLVQGMYQIGT